MPDLWMDVDVALTEVPVNIMPLLDDTDFKSREVSIAYNAAGMDLVWNFVTTAGAYTQTAVTPTTGGNYDWAHQGDGMYSIEIPASGGATINNDTEGFGWFSGIATGVLPWRGPIIGFRASGLNDALIDSAYSTTRGLAGTALPAAAADAAGGLPISDAGGLDLDAQIGTDIDAILVDTGTTLDGRIPAALVSGRIDASVGAMAAGVVTAAAVATGAIDADAIADNAIDAGAIATGAITAAKFAAGALDAAALAADAGVEIATAVWALATRTLTAATNITSTGGTTVPQTGDSFARIGAPVGASISADIASVLAKVFQGVPRNIALANFPFVMTNSTTHAPEAGATVTCTRSIDGGAFGGGALSGLTEVGSGLYVVDFANSDLNGKTVILRCTASGCDDTIVTIVTED